jgi:signal peptidase I
VPVSDVWDSPAAEPNHRRARWPFVLVAVGLLAVLLVGWWASQNLFCGFSLTRGFTVPSPAMEPTISAGDRIRVVETQSVGRGDVVVFETPPGMEPSPVTKFVSRIVAVGGDRIEPVDGQLRINGAIVEEPYVNPDCGGPLTGAPLQPQTIPDGQVFVMSDGRCMSKDSRAYGPIPVSSIVGRVCGGDLHSP